MYVIDGYDNNYKHKQLRLLYASNADLDWHGNFTLPDSIARIGSEKSDAVVRWKDPNLLPKLALHIRHSHCSYTKELESSFLTTHDNAMGSYTEKELTKGSVFSECTKLRGVRILKGETKSVIIDESAYANCPNLELFELERDCLLISDNTFYNCPNLHTVKLPESITSIGNMVFAKCINLRAINFSRNLISIGDGAFLGCTSFEDIYLPAYLISIGSLAFAHTNIKTITIPDTICSIGSNPFLGCDNLQTIIILSQDDEKRAKIASMLPANLQHLIASKEKTSAHINKRLSLFQAGSIVGQEPDNRCVIS